MSLPGAILVLNTGSSSVKFASFDADLQERIRGVAEGIGGEGRLRIGAEILDLPCPATRRPWPPFWRIYRTKVPAPNTSAPWPIVWCMAAPA